ncbi:MAG: response regulator [Deltaproteobacteria bacterium]|nr:response regulator [Deltaproteobacteria bacterium]
MPGKIFVVEDEPRLASLLADYLRQAGYEPHCIGDGGEVVSRVREQAPDLVLLDLMLPGKDGIEICKEIRAFSSLPIVMVTARVEEIDRLLGLELGADDYICKPFSPREVVARVKAVLRRADGRKDAPHPGLKLDKERYKAVLHGRDLDLTVVEFQLMHFLAGHPGRIFSRSQLMDGIYPDRRVVSDRTIDSHVKKLRRKIEAAAPGEEWIHSVYGAGYKFEEPS